MRDRKKASIDRIELGGGGERREVEEAQSMKGILSHGKEYEF